MAVSSQPPGRGPAAPAAGRGPAAPAFPPLPPSPGRPAPASHLPPPPRLRPLHFAALAGFALVVLIVHLDLTVRRPGTALFSFDSAEYALAGRTLARTGRLATPFVHPTVLGKVHGPPFPLVVGNPLVPVLEAVLFAAGGARPGLTLVPSALAYLAAVLLTAALAMRAGASRAVAATAACAFALSPAVLRFTTEGLSELPFTALFAAALVLLWDLAERPRPALLGAVLGLAHLARPVALPLLPAWLAAIWLMSPPDRRARQVLVTLAGFAPFAVGLALYKWSALGNPFAEVASYLLLVRMTPEFTTARLNRTVPPLSPWSYLAAHPGALIRKAAVFAPSFLYGAWTAAGHVLGALFAFRLIAPGDRRDRVFQGTLLVFGALLAALALVTVPDPRMLLPLAPAVFALGFAEAFRLARGRGFTPRSARTLVLILALGTSALPALQTWRTTAAGPAANGFREVEWAALGQGLARALPREGLVASDAAPWVAWYAERDVTLVPLETRMLADLSARAPISAVVITNEWLIDQPGEEEWRAWFDGSAHDPDWVCVERLHAGRLRAAVFKPARAVGSGG